MLRVLLYHGEAYGNLGDEAMLLCAARRIRRCLGSVHFVVPRAAGAPLPDLGAVTEVEPPGAFTKQLAARLVPLRRLRARLEGRRRSALPWLIRSLTVRAGGLGPWRRILRELRDCDAVYFVGAANLNDLARYLCLLPKCLLAEEAHRLGKPAVFSSQMVGPLELPWARRMMGRTLQQADLFSIRDGGVSREALRGVADDPDALPIVGDEALSLPPAPSDRAQAFLERCGVDGGGPFAVLHFRETDYTGPTEAHYRKIADALDRTRARARFVFLPMSRHLHDDRRCGEAIRRRMRRPEKLHVLDCPPSAELARAVVQRARWVAALSYHVQVFALAAGRPMCLLTSGRYYGVKARGMRMLVGPQTPLCDLSACDADDIARAMQGLERDGAERCEAIAAVRDRLLRANDLPVDALARALGAGRRADGGRSGDRRAQPAASERGSR
jgi:polysaccharide pyruvyl transferase WcaK-like protein